MRLGGYGDDLALAFPQTEILTAFLDESPHLADVAKSLGDGPVVAAPLLMGGGPHVDVDLARALTAPRTPSGLRRMTEAIRILSPILEWPELASLTLEAIDSASRPPASFGPNLRARPARVRPAGTPDIVARSSHAPTLGPGSRGPGTLARVYVHAAASGVTLRTLTGRVWLVGAGPGDAGLITVPRPRASRARRCGRV